MQATHVRTPATTIVQIAVINDIISSSSVCLFELTHDFESGLIAL